jgi:hypothetical protein
VPAQIAEKQTYGAGQSITWASNTRASAFASRAFKSSGNAFNRMTVLL